MDYHLLIDRGNTSVKCYLWNPATDSPERIETCEGAVDAAFVDSLVSGVPVSGAIYASVAEHDDAMLDALHRCVPVVVELTRSTPMDIGIDYGTPDTLGVDRLAAAIGAIKLFPGRDLLVVDAGTAVTYDRVSRDKVFMGGNIAPGLDMRLMSLNEHTRRLPLVAIDPAYDQVWGSDTATALMSGALMGVVAEIEFYARMARRQAQDVVTVVSGGWCRELAVLADINGCADPLLVARGLNAILEYNLSRTSAGVQ